MTGSASSIIEPPLSVALPAARRAVAPSSASTAGSAGAAAASDSSAFTARCSSLKASRIAATARQLSITSAGASRRRGHRYARSLRYS